MTYKGLRHLTISTSLNFTRLGTGFRGPPLSYKPFWHIGVLKHLSVWKDPFLYSVSRSDLQSQLPNFFYFGVSLPTFTTYKIPSLYFSWFGSLVPTKVIGQMGLRESTEGISVFFRHTPYGSVGQRDEPRCTESFRLVTLFYRWVRSFLSLDHTTKELISYDYLFSTIV